MDKRQLVEIISSHHMCHDHCFDGELYCACRVAAEAIMALLAQEDKKNLQFYDQPDYGKETGDEN